MPEIVVKHNVKDATPPQREVLPSGTYHANIVKVTPGLTNFEPKLQTISIEYSIVKTAAASIVNEEPEDKYHGRSVYQDYIIERGNKEFTNQREAFRIQQLMAATKCPYKTHEGGQISFNTDHLLTKGVKITVTQRAGKKREGDDPKAPIPLFNNVDRVDSEIEVPAEGLV
jgi:hypothetical protein